MNNKSNNDALESILRALDQVEVKHFAFLYKEVSKIFEGKGFEQIREYEYIAFAHFPGAGKNLGWKTYYGPYCSFPDPINPGRIKAPFNQEMITADTIAHWQERAFSSKSPLLAFRYADLVIDYHEAGLHKSEDIHKYVERYADALIEIATKINQKTFRQQPSVYTFIWMIPRCTHILLQFDRGEKLKRLAQSYLPLEQEFGTDDKPGLWGIVAEYLLLDERARKFLDKDIESAIVKDIEERFERITNRDGASVIAHNKACNLLKRYNQIKMPSKK